MKKNLLLVFCLSMVMCLAACQSDVVVDGNDNEQIVVDEGINGSEEIDNTELGESETVELGDVEEEQEVVKNQKTSLTLEELNEIDMVMFPRAYSYEIYNWTDEVVSDEGRYEYPENIDHSLLLPIHATMTKREVVSSILDSGLLYTNVNLTLQDGTIVSVLYINDASTLQYVGATINTEADATIYTFEY